MFSTSYPSLVAIYPKFGKRASALVCALVCAAHPSVSKEVEGYTNNFVSF
jgi:hypothetical protein